MLNTGTIKSKLRSAVRWEAVTGRIVKGTICLVAVGLVGTVGAVYAAAPLPHAFYGTVTLNGQPAAAGTIVTATVNDGDCGSYTTTVVGQYGNLAQRDYLTVSCFDLEAGDTIEFHISGIKADQTATFEVGGGPTELNLTAAGETAPLGVITESAAAVTTSSATLNANLVSLGPASYVDACFQWGTTTGYGNETTAEAMTAPGGFSSSLDNLSPGTTYHFRAEAIAGEAPPTYGSDKIFVTPTPAGFTVSNLSLSPSSVNPGGEVTITAKVTNTGDAEGSYTATLKINGAAQATKQVTLAPDASTTVAFVAEASNTAGTYAVEIGGQSASFTVTGGGGGGGGQVPAAASFTVSNLSLSPNLLNPGQNVTITAKVTNTGGTEGSYTATLKINGAAQATKEVTLAAGASTTVSFVVEAGDAAGDYAVEIGGQSTTFTVTAGQAPAASFTVSNLSLSPNLVNPGAEVTIMAKVTNTGGTEGSYSATLKINGAAQTTKEITLAPDSSTTVSFVVEAGDAAGDYAVEINGQSTSFKVATAAEPRSTNWTVIIGAVAILLALILWRILVISLRYR